MALVGEAHVIVRAITNNVSRDIQRGFNNLNGVGTNAGNNLGRSFSRGFNKNINASMFTRISNGIKTLAPGAEQARKAFQRLVQSGYAIGTVISVLIGGISSLVAGIGAIGGSVGGAAASLAVLGNALFAVVAAMAAAKLALGGVGKAIRALNKGTGGGGGGGGAGNAAAVEAANRRVRDAEQALAQTIERNRENLLDANNAVRDAQLSLNEALKEGREEIQQLGFDAEDAAISEQKAAIDLERAREELARLQDLPPNSRVRREAELAYQEAELNYRRAKDNTQDLAAEQDRLAQSGVGGTQVVIDATNALAEAETQRFRTVRDGLRAETEANEALADARKAAADAGKSSGGGGGGGQDIFAGLNAAQIHFAKFIAGLKPKFDELKLIAANSFLPPLERAITTLMNAAFPAVAIGIGKVGRALGEAVNSLVAAITTAEDIRDLGNAFDNASTLIKQFGIGLGSLASAFLSLINGAAPQAERFFGFLADQLDKFDTYLDRLQANGQLEDFFQRSGDLAAELGDIIGNVFGGFRNIIRANFGAGSGGAYLLTWLRNATQRWRDLGATIEGQRDLTAYFRNVAVNAQKVLSTLGALVGILRNIGANQSIGLTFDILRQGAPALQAILQSAINAGPALAELVLQFTKFINLTTDTGAMVIFFQTLTGALQILNDLMGNEFIFTIVTVIGQLTAMFLAFNLIFKVGKFGFNVILGSIQAVTGAIGAATDRIVGFGAASQVAAGPAAKLRGVLGGISSLFGGPWGLAIIAAIAGLKVFSDYADSLKSTSAEVSNALTTATTRADLLKTVLKGYDFGNLADINAQFDHMGTVLDDLKGQDDLWINRLNTSTFGFLQSLKGLSPQLADLANQSLPQAQTAFNLLTEDQDLSRQQLLTLIDKMPEYKDALTNQATQMGINVSSTNKLANENALLQLAMGNSADTAKKKLNEALREMSGATGDAKYQIDSLNDAILGFGSVQLDANKAAREYEASLDDMTSSIKAQKDAYIAQHGSLNGFVFDMSTGTEAGRQNQEMLENVAQATKEHAAAVYAQTGDVNAATQAIASGRDALVKQLVQLGYTQKGAEDYADSLGLIPKNIITTIKADTAAARKVMDKFIQDYKDKKIPISAVVRAADRVSRNGNLFSYANGGFGALRAFASGGFPTGVFEAGRQPLYKFAEPETRWEAFVSGRPGQENRNLGILNEAARRLGATPTGGGDKIDIHVYPQPNQSPAEIAQEVNRELSFRQRKGGLN